MQGQLKKKRKVHTNNSQTKIKQKGSHPNLVNLYFVHSKQYTKLLQNVSHMTSLVSGP